jgi:hypothetical protein
LQCPYEYELNSHRPIIYLHGKKGKESAMSMETKEEKDPAVDVEATQAHLFSRQPPTVLGRIAFWAFLWVC